MRSLAEKGLYPRLRLVALERELSDVVGDTRKAEARLAAAEAAVAEAESRQVGLEREQRSIVLAELAEAEAERDRLAEARRRAEALLRNMVVRAPVDGIVQELAVTTPGQSVGSNQPIMKLVPTGGGLVIEARVDNQDVGYVRVGQDATVKVRAFDFLRYGTLDGRVERIAADASVDPDSNTYPYRIIVRTDARRSRRRRAPPRGGAGHDRRRRPAGRRAHHPLLSHRPHPAPARGRLPRRVSSRLSAAGRAAGRSCRRRSGRPRPCRS